MAGTIPNRGTTLTFTTLPQVWVHPVAAQRGAGGFFPSLSPKMSVMLNLCAVNLQPAAATRSLSTKEGNKAMQGGGRRMRSVERDGMDAYTLQAEILFQIPVIWETMAIMASFLLFFKY